MTCGYTVEQLLRVQHRSRGECGASSAMYRCTLMYTDKRRMTGCSRLLTFLPDPSDCAGVGASLRQVGQGALNKYLCSECEAPGLLHNSWYIASHHSEEHSCTIDKRILDIDVVTMEQIASPADRGWASARCMLCSWAAHAGITMCSHHTLLHVFGRPCLRERGAWSQRRSSIMAAL